MIYLLPFKDVKELDFEPKNYEHVIKSMNTSILRFRKRAAEREGKQMVITQDLALMHPHSINIYERLATLSKTLSLLMQAVATEVSYEARKADKEVQQTAK